MAKDKLQVILDALWRGKRAVQQAEKDVSGLDKTVSKTSVSWRSLATGAAVATGAIVAIGGAAKIAFAELERGAQLTAAAGQFDRLTESIDSTSEAMLGRLQEAGRGLVSNANLIAGANEIMAGKLAKSEDGVVRLSAAAGALNVDMGLLAQTINNQSILRLDNMGVAAEDVVPKFNELKDAGLGVKEAFTEALTLALESKVELLGEASETTAGKIQIMQTAWQNARDAFSIGFAEGAAEEVARLGDSVDIATESFQSAGQFWGNISAALVTNIFGVSAAQDELKRALDAGIITQGEYNQKLDQMQYGTLSVGSAIQFVNEKQADFAFSLRASTSGLDAQIAAASTADRVMLQYAGSVATAADANKKLAFAGGFRFSRDIQQVTSLSDAQLAAGAGNRSATAAEEREKAAFRAQRQQEVAIQGWEDYAEAERGVIAETERLAEEGDNLANSFFGMASGASAAADEMAALDAATGNFFDQARRATDFNPAEVFYEQALAAGASAEKLREVLIGTGLESAERAQEIYEQALQRQQITAGAQAFAAQGGISLEQAFGGGQGIAAADFSGSNVDQSSTVNVGGVTVIIQGSANQADLEMGIDNAFAQVAASEGVGQ